MFSLYPSLSLSLSIIQNRISSIPFLFAIVLLMKHFCLFEKLAKEPLLNAKWQMLHVDSENTVWLTVVLYTLRSRVYQFILCVNSFWSVF